jgi:putative solute:sodium symporter small subunit
MAKSQEDRNAYWRANLKLMGGLMAIWFLVSFGAGILFVDALNTIHIGGFKLGFWFAQQGSIFVFIALIFAYVYGMHRLDLKFGLDDKDEVDSYDLVDDPTSTTTRGDE